MSSHIATPVLKRFLGTVAKRYKIAKADRTVQWPNRCLRCQAPLMTPWQKHTICTHCWDELQEEENRYDSDGEIPCCMCGADCSGGDYERYRFCTRRCMVQCSRGDRW